MICLQADMAMASAAVRDLLIGEYRVDLELKTARVALGLPDGSIILRNDHPLVNSAIGAGTGAC